MKKILNYGITYIEHGENNDIMFFRKINLIEKYIELLKSKSDISSLTCYMWEGVKDPKYKDITGNINRFLDK